MDQDSLNGDDDVEIANNVSQNYVRSKNDKRSLVYAVSYEE